MLVHVHNSGHVLNIKQCEITCITSMLICSGACTSGLSTEAAAALGASTAIHNLYVFFFFSFFFLPLPAFLLLAAEVACSSCINSSTN